MLRLGVFLAFAVTALHAPAAPAATIVYQCPGGQEVCAVDPDTGARATLTRGGTQEHPNYSGSLSEDGRSLSYVHRGAIHATTLDGAPSSEVTGGKTYSAAFGMKGSPAGTAWLWDQHITIGGTTRNYTYHYRSGGPEPKSYAVNADGYGWLGETPVAALEINDGNPSTPASHVCEIDEGGELCARELVADPNRLLAFPDGSPDGTAIVAVAESPGRGNRTFGGPIALYSVRTGALVRDLTSGTEDSVPSFSPDGKRVAFQRGGGIWIADVGGGERRITDGVNPSWGGGTLGDQPGDASDSTAPRATIGGRRRRPRGCTLSGRATDDAGGSGVAAVEVNVVRRTGRRCAAYTGRRFVRMRCAKAAERFVRADSSAGRWKLRLRGAKRGRHVVRARATDRSGNVQRTPARKTLRVR